MTPVKGKLYRYIERYSYNIGGTLNPGDVVMFVGKAEPPKGWKWDRHMALAMLTPNGSLFYWMQGTVFNRRLATYFKKISNV